MDSGGIRLEPIGSNGGTSSTGITSRRQTSVGTQNIGTQTQGVSGALEITPENTEAIRAALKNAPIDILQKALRDADVQITQYTMDIVKSLINGSLPLTEENIVDLLLQSHAFKDAQPDVLALMMRLEIPATPENIEQFENLINKGEKLSENLQSLINRLPAEIFKGTQNLPELSFVLNEIAKMIAEQAEQPEMPQVQRQNNQEGAQQRQSAQNNIQETVQQIQTQNNNQGAKPVLTRYELNTLLNMLRGLGASNQILNKVININRQNAEISHTQSESTRSQSEPNVNLNNLNRAGQSSQASQNVNEANNVKQTNQNTQTAQIRPANSENMLEVINKFVQDTAAKVSQRQQDSEGSRSFFANIKNMLESPAIQKLIKVEIQEKCVLTPQDLMKGSPELSKFYNVLNNNLHKFEQLLRLFNPSIANAANITNNSENKPQNINNNVYMQTKNVRDNLTLMNEVGKTMPFLQIPLKFSNEKIINSDLYILNNKKKKNTSPVKSVNALIKLELENLGGVDVYINIAGKNARARFFTDKSEAVDEITKNLPELDETIHNLGFNFTSAAAAADKEREFDILDDFINRETPKTEIRKYILRKKI